jgi:T4-like virus Myoviridae tail sheath stabiliser
MEYFYDGQIRRYLTQFMRLMSNFSYSDNKGNLTRVPVRYGDMNRQVAQILMNNSENTMPTAPLIGCYIKNLEVARNRLQEPTHISKVQIKERDTWYNPQTGLEEYLNVEGENYTVERLMPVPYDLTFQADIWTTNTDQKLQLIEQMLVLFRPSLELQTTDNYLDWTSLSVLELTELTFSSRQIPQGTEQDIDIATLQFSTPIWLTTPAKVKQMGIITNIITSIFVEPEGTLGSGEYHTYTETDFFGGRSATAVDGTTLGDLGVLILDGTAKLLAPAEGVSNDEVPYKYGVNISWLRILDQYPGKFQAGLSQIRLKKPSGTEIIARISLDPADESVMHLDFDVDTIPADSQVPPNSGKTYVDAIIDPTTFNPVNPVAGIRYLILEDINTDPKLAQAIFEDQAAKAWRNTDGTYLQAHANDIITWSGTTWTVVFDSQSVTDLTYITNIRTGIQYVWDGSMWSKSFEGEYRSGNWRLIL